MPVDMRWFPALGLLALWCLVAAPALALDVRFVPAAPRPGDLVVVSIEGEPPLRVTGALGERSLAFFARGRVHVAVAGVDLDTPARPLAWQVRVEDVSGRARHVAGTLAVTPREFTVQRLSVPGSMVDLDPETERRALAETARLRAVYGTVTADRLWEGRFVRPVPGEGPGRGFGARRVINGKPRAPHAGVDFAAVTGTPVFAANRGRVALVGEFFFPGRLVVLDHGLGLHTLYFHLDRIDVNEGVLVERGATIGAVGATGRVTGPHLHFGAQVRESRVDPDLLFTLSVPD